VVSAESAEHLFRQVSGMVSDFAEIPGPGQRARDGNGEHEDEQVAAPAPLPRVRDPGEHLQQARDLPGLLFIGAGHDGIAGMRN
jgi:hypothetical protein